MRILHLLPRARRLARSLAGGALAAVVALGTVTVTSGTAPAHANGVVAPHSNGEIAFTDSSGLWVGDASGQHRTRLVAYQDWARYPSFPLWSHAGTRLAYLFGDEVWVINADGTGKRQVTFFGGRFHIVSATSWYPDDTKVAFATRTSGGPGLLQWYALDGSASGGIGVPGGLGADAPAVSPDGTTVAFAGGAAAESTQGIYTMHLDGSGLRRLTGPFGTDMVPSWSPDGRLLAFTNVYGAATGVSYRAMVMNADGSAGRVLRADASVGGWSPDGRLLSVLDLVARRAVTLRPDGTGAQAVGGCTPVRSGFDWRPVASPVTPAERAWGWNGVGQLGDGTTVDRAQPVAAGLSGVVAVVAGYHHSLALRDDGTVWAWGWNAVGQLGIGTTDDSKVPVQVPGLTSVTCLAAGAYHSLAVRSDGTVWAWGLNNFGQLGDGSTTTHLLPRLVSGLTADSVAAGVGHSLALSSDGRVWAWGWNIVGQVGNGSAYDSHQPVQIAGWGTSSSRVTSIAAGAYHSLAGTTNGVVAWGWNHFGQVGDGTTRDWPVPTAVQGLYGDVVQVAAGAFHSLALKDDGSLFAWGNDTVGELGDGSTTDSFRPKQIPFAAPVSAVSAGVLHSLAISSGTLFTWGWNPLGQLGDGSTAERHVPGTVPGPAVSSVSGGALHSLAA